MPSANLLSIQNAEMVIVAIGAVGVLIWLAAVVLWLATRRPNPIAPRSRDLPTKSALAVRDAMPRAAALQQPVWDLIGGDTRHAIFDLPLSGHPRLRAEVAPLPGAEAGPGAAGCRVTCSVEAAPTASWYTILMPAWLLLMPAVILAAGIALWTTVAHSPSPALRGQAMQMAQIVHVLWPPFVFWGRQRYTRTALRGLQDRFLTTLELL